MGKSLIPWRIYHPERMLLSSMASPENSEELEDICWFERVINGWQKESEGEKGSWKLSLRSCFYVVSLDYTWSASVKLLHILSEEWFHRRMWRHNTRGMFCLSWCLLLSPGDPGSEKHTYIVTFISSSGLLTILRWPASQSRATSQPQSALWRNAWGRQKDLSFVNHLSAVGWKGKCNRKHLYSGWQWQQAMK